MKRPSYHAATEWIAVNDNAGNDDVEQEVACYITTALVADLWGLSTEKVANDVYGIRKRIDAQEQT